MTALKPFQPLPLIAKQLVLTAQLKPGERVDLDITNEDLGLTIERALASQFGRQWREAAEAEKQSLIDLKTWKAQV